MSHAKHVASDNDASLREQLIEMLHAGHAHSPFDNVVRGFPIELAGVRPANAPHSVWELLEHLRIAQNDILRFSQSADYVSPKWPEGYWPSSPAPRDKAQWDDSVRSFRDDLAEFESLLRDPEQDLFRRLPWGDGQTLLREALLLADHNSHHLGQMILVRKLLGVWE